MVPPFGIVLFVVVSFEFRRWVFWTLGQFSAVDKFETDSMNGGLQTTRVGGSQP